MSYQIAHILFGHLEAEDIVSENSKKQALEKAEESLDRIKNDNVAFEIIASQVSDCPSGALGGLLGQVEKGEMVPEFEEIVFNLEPGEVSNIFESEYGYHIAWRYNDDLLDEAFKS